MVLFGCDTTTFKKRNIKFDKVLLKNTLAPDIYLETLTVTALHGARQQVIQPVHLLPAQMTIDHVEQKRRLFLGHTTFT